MIRRFFILISLFIAILGAGIWVNAYSPRTTVYCWGTNRHSIFIVNICGQIFASYYLDYPLGLPDGFSKRAAEEKEYCPEGWHEAWYVAVLPWTYRPSPTSWCIAAAIRPWLFVLLGLIYPLYVFGVLPFVIRRRRQQKGLCIHCAYDLTGNESGVCPECGKRTVNVRNQTNES